MEREMAELFREQPVWNSASRELSLRSGGSPGLWSRNRVRKIGKIDMPSQRSAVAAVPLRSDFLDVPAFP
jgi:hypothetical protein